VAALSEVFGRHVAPALNALGDHTYLAAIRAGMVSVVPLTIIGGLFMIVAFLPLPGWEARIESYLPLLQVPVTATFGLLGVFVCFGIGYDLARRFKLDPLVSASMATLIFLMIQLELPDLTLSMEGLGSKGLFTGILVALVTVRVQKLFSDWNLVLKLPENVPQIVYESFVSLTSMFFLVVVFWILRFVLGVDINRSVEVAFRPLVFTLNTLPGILTYAFLVTLLWSVGINGDNAMDALVAPVFLQFLAANVEATTRGEPLPYVTANGFFTTFVNVGGTGATIALAFVLWNSRDPGFRRVSRLSLPTQIFQINEPIFFGLPIVMNPVFMAPYILNALLLTAGTYLLMSWGVIQKPFVNVPWTTPPVIGHYLVTGGDWRAAIWGVCSILIAMTIYFPFARFAARQRQAGIKKAESSDSDNDSALESNRPAIT
jgi:PTS system cellobiose-specific IIC component